MAEIRFRPLVCGPVGEALVFPIYEEADGQAVYWIPEWSWPLDVPLDQATVEDVPEFCRPKGGPLRLFPVEVATGTTRSEAYRRMWVRIGELARGKRTQERQGGSQEVG